MAGSGLTRPSAPANVMAGLGPAIRQRIEKRRLGKSRSRLSARLESRFHLLYSCRGGNKQPMENDIKFYNQPSAGREDWYRLVIRDDDADPFIEHTWSYRNPDGTMEMYTGRACIPILDFLSKEYPKEAKSHFRKLLATMAPGESYPCSEPE
ncbi:MAG: hypothetical protein WAN43_12075 [Rhodomicrobium sp.]